MAQVNQATATELEAIPDALLIPIERIRPMKEQPRSEWDEERDAELRSQIERARENGGGIAGTGILQPLLGRWEAGAFDEDGELRPGALVLLVAGERRLRAASALELPRVPVVVTDKTTEQAYEEAVMENLARADLSPYDEGRAFQYLMNKHGIGRVKLSRMLYGNTSREGYIQNRLDLLRLPDDVKQLVSQRADSVAVARRIATVSDKEARTKLIELAQNGATSKTVEAAIRKAKNLGPATIRPEKRESTLTKDEQEAFRLGQDFERTPKNQPSLEGALTSNEPDDIRTSFGSSRSAEAKATLPRVSIADALESTERVLQIALDALNGQLLAGQPVTPSQRATLSHRVHNVQVALDALIEKIKS